MITYSLAGAVVGSVSLNNRAFLYGDGFFTTLRVCAGKPQLWAYHLKRLVHCATALHMSIDQQAVQSAVFKHAMDIQNGMIKVQVFRQSGSERRGYAPSSQEGEVFIGAHQECGVPLASETLHSLLPIQPPSAVALLSQRLAFLPENLAGLKSLNRMENILAANELRAIQQQLPDVAEGMLCSVNDFVIEAVSSNLFFYCDGEWMTPALTNSGVEGTMRQAILDAYEVSVVDVPMTRLGEVESAFLCNAIRGIRPVTSLYDVTTREYVLERLNIQPVTQLYDTLCDNASFVAHLS